MKILSILNPISGKNRNIRDDVIQKLMNSDLVIQYESTTLDRNATAIINEQVVEPEIIILSGGDGTISEAVQGLHSMNFNSKLLIIPSGTTNEIASNLGIDTTFEGVFERLSNPKSSETISIDYGLMANEITFTYSLSFGTFTELTYKTPQKLKNLFGYIGYLVYGFFTFRKINNQKLTILHDDHMIQGNFTFGTITNSKTIGGVLDLSKQNPILDDGLFEVLLIKSPNTWKKYRDIIKSIKNKDYDNSNFIQFKSSNLELQFDSAVDINIDGEFGGNFEKFTVDNITKSLFVIR